MHAWGGTPSSLVDLGARRALIQVVQRGHLCLYRLSCSPVIAISSREPRRGAAWWCATTPAQIQQ